jgi:hypothetical protein
MYVSHNWYEVIFCPFHDFYTTWLTANNSRMAFKLYLIPRFLWSSFAGDRNLLNSLHYTAYISLQDVSKYFYLYCITYSTNWNYFTFVRRHMPFCSGSSHLWEMSKSSFRSVGRPTDSQLKSTTRTNCCIFTVHLLMMGYKYAQTCRGWLTKLTEDK